MVYEICQGETHVTVTIVLMEDILIYCTGGFPTTGKNSLKDVAVYFCAIHWKYFYVKMSFGMLIWNLSHSIC